MSSLPASQRRVVVLVMLGVFTAILAGAFLGHSGRMRGRFVTGQAAGTVLGTIGPINCSPPGNAICFGSNSTSGCGTFPLGESYTGNIPFTITGGPVVIEIDVEADDSATVKIDDGLAEPIAADCLPGKKKLTLQNGSHNVSITATDGSADWGQAYLKATVRIADDSPAECGDDVCDGTEDCSTCDADCGVCEPECGDGTCDDNEDCDSCSEDCGSCDTCGDGTVDPGEDCDGTNLNGEDCVGRGYDSGTLSCDACSYDESDCYFDEDSYCGDGTCDDDEDCDWCDEDCGQCPSSASSSSANRCGNDVMDPGEECDDGNNDDGDGCSADCTEEGYCGDGATGNGIDGDEECDYADDSASFICGGILDIPFWEAECDTNCSCQKINDCGNGTRDAGEDCDGSALGGATCQSLGFDSGTLTCDNACGYDTSGCETDQQECGDGNVDPGEECDDGNDVNNDACTNACKDAACGDGIKQQDEECDDGNQTDTDACTNACKNAKCGDGIVRSGTEECDDGNTAAGDGCAANCSLEEFDFGMQIVNVCQSSSAGGTGGGNGGGGNNGGGGGGGDTGGGGGSSSEPSVTGNTDIHNVNGGGGTAYVPPQSFFASLLSQLGGTSGQWPAMRLTLDIVDLPGGDVRIPAPITAKVYRGNKDNPHDINETVSPIVSNGGDRIVYETKGGIPIGYDFATWIYYEASGVGGKVLVTYNPKSEAPPPLPPAPPFGSSQGDKLHQRSTIDLRTGLSCKDFAVDKDQACPGEALVYLGTFLNVSKSTAAPRIPLHPCLDPSTVTALEPETCIVKNGAIECPPMPVTSPGGPAGIKGAMVSFLAYVKDSCPAGTTITVYGEANYMPPDTPVKKTVNAVTKVLACGQQSSRSSARSSSSVRSSSLSSSSVRSSSSSVSARSSSSVRTSVTSSVRPPSSGPAISSSARSSVRSSSSRSVTVSFSQPSSVTVSFSQPSSTVITLGSVSSVGGGIGGTSSLPLSTDIPCSRDVDCPVGSRCLQDGRCTVASLPSNRGTVAAAISICGNTEVEFGEECDDGNARDFDGCSSDCLSERGFCGDGTVQRLLGEQCESGFEDGLQPAVQCVDCRYESTSCGDGVVDPGEECDEGAQNRNQPNAVCRRACILARCGDTIVDTLRDEECDDGNRVSGDGCTGECRIERGAPTGSPLSAQVFEFPTGPGTTPPSWAQVTPQQGGQVPLTGVIVPPSNPGTGPASLAVMAAGAAAGIGWARRKRRRSAE